MDVILVLPFYISLYLVIRGKIETAFLWVYLPALLLLPHKYAIHPPQMPPISVAQGALIPIGVVALFRLITRGRPVFLDLLVVMFLIGTGVSEVLRERVMNTGIFVTTDTVVSILFAYAVGRTLIEPQLRSKTVRRIVLCVLLIGPFGLVEWRLGQNIYGIVAHRIFAGVELAPNVQIRSGRGRFSASFDDAEIAGIAIGMTLALNSWMHFLSKKRPELGIGKWQRRMEKFQVPGILLILYMLATQSRGPLLAFGAAWMLLQLRKFKHRKTAFLVVAIVLAVGGYVGYLRFLHYTNVATSVEISNEMQGSAVYRRQMYDLYQPIAEQGGMLGWSMLSRPVLPGMFSIDNEYLLLHIAYGTIGITLFLLIAAETFRHLIAQLWKRQEEEDLVFTISMLGAMAVFWLTIYTVYMGEQLPQFAFLLIGWSRSLRPQARSTAVAVEQAEPSKFAFRRVYQ
jgi:hypothetical protein